MIPSFWRPWIACLLATPLGAQTPPTNRLADLNPDTQPADSNPAGFVQLGAHLYFTALEPSGRNLWVTDGTGTGSQRLVDPDPQSNQDVDLLRVVGSSLVFRMSGSLWSCDPQTASVTSIALVEPLAAPENWHGGAPMPFAARDAHGDEELWITNGRAAGTMRLADLNPGTFSSSPADFHSVLWDDGQGVRDLTFFTAFTPNEGRELHVVENGVVQRVIDLERGPGDGTPTTELATYVDPTRHELYVAFVGWKATTGSELFRLKRSPSAPTFQLEALVEVNSGTGDADPSEPLTRDRDVVFVAANPLRGRELWSLEYATGRLALIDIAGGMDSSSPASLMRGPDWNGGRNPSVYLRANTTATGSELWVYDGTGHTLVADIDGGAGSSTPQILAHADGKLWFAADDGSNGRELHCCDGTSLGTGLAYDIARGGSSSDPLESGVLDVGSGRERVIFAATRDLVTGREPHVIDSASAGSLLIDIHPTFGEGSSPGMLGRLSSGRGVFLARVPGFPGQSMSLYTTDGTPQGTTPSVATGPYVGPFLALDDDSFVVFVGQPITNPMNPFNNMRWELWHVRDTGVMHSVSLSQNPNNFLPPLPPTDVVEYGEKVYFAYGLVLGERRIYEYDRAGHVTQRFASMPQDWDPSSLTTAGRFLYFTASDVLGRELWAWTGSGQPYRVSDIDPNGSSSPRDLIEFNNRIFFTADDGVHGRELWSSSGIGSGTNLLLDIQSGSTSSEPGVLVSTGPALFFTADDGIHGREVWRTNGYTSGTVLAADINPGSASSSPDDLTMVHVDRIACTADDGVHGEELYLIGSQGATLFDLNPGAASSAPRRLHWTSRMLLFAADDGQAGSEPWYADWVDFGQVAMLRDVAPGPQSSDPSSFSSFGNHGFFAADDQGRYGREPWVVDVEAGSQRVGPACPARDNTLQLRSTAPRLGGNFTYWVYEPGPPSIALVYLGLPTTTPVPSSIYGCRFQMYPLIVFLIDQFPTAGGYVRTIGIPNDPALAGGNVRFQIFHADTSGAALQFYITNALDLWFG